MKYEDTVVEKIAGVYSLLCATKLKDRGSHRIRRESSGH